MTLSEEEIKELKTIGIVAENWFAVCYDKNSKPIALFSEEDYAKAYRDQFTATSIIEPWPMTIKDYRNGGGLLNKQ